MKNTFLIPGKSGDLKLAFRFNKPATGFVDDLWIKPHDCQLIKLFADSGVHCRYPEGNPYPLNETTMWTLGNPHFK